MEILVCVKQVPGTTEVEVDPVTGVLRRDGVSSKMNPYDLYAVELGLRLAEETGGHVRALSMGRWSATGGWAARMCWPPAIPSPRRCGPRERWI